MFVRTMIDGGNAGYCGRKHPTAGRSFCSPGCRRRIQLPTVLPARPALARLTLAVLVLAVLTLGSCRSVNDSVPIPDPYFSGVRHFDVAFILVQDAPPADIIRVYSQASLQFTETSRIDRAEGVLRNLDGHILAAKAGGLVLAPAVRVDRLIAWHALAGVNELAAPTAQRYTSEILTDIGKFSDDDDAESAKILRRVLEAQLANPNLDEDSLRRTLDEFYLLNDDTVRVSALVDTAEQIARLDDLRTLNPVVQQSIAALPVIPAPLIASSLSIRLAELSIRLDRMGDVASLLDQARRRAQEGLIVDRASYFRLEDIITGAVRIDSVEGGRAEAVLDVILSNVSPQSMRIRGQGMAALALSGEDRYDSVYAQMVQISDPTLRALISAEFLRERAHRHPDWVIGSVISDLLNGVELGRTDPADRIRILSDLAAVYFYTGQPDEFDRLRGLISGNDEYNRILLRLAETMVSTGRDDEARRAIAGMSGIPDSGSFDGSLDGPSPRLRLAELHRQLGEYDRAITVAEGLGPPELSRFLVTLPADFLPNPVSNAVLDRMVR